MENGALSSGSASCCGAPGPVGTGADRTTTRSGAELRIGSSLHHLFDQKVVRQDDYLDFIPLGSAIGHRTGGSGDKVGPYSHPQGRSAPVLPLLRCAPSVGLRLVSRRGRGGAGAARLKQLRRPAVECRVDGVPQSRRTLRVGIAPVRGRGLMPRSSAGARALPTAWRPKAQRVRLSADVGARRF